MYSTLYTKTVRIYRHLTNYAFYTYLCNRFGTCIIYDDAIVAQFPNKYNKVIINVEIISSWFYYVSYFMFLNDVHFFFFSVKGRVF